MDEHNVNEITYDSITGLRDRKTFFVDIKRNADAQKAGQIVLIQLTQLQRVNRKYGVSVADS